VARRHCRVFVLLRALLKPSGQLVEVLRASWNRRRQLFLSPARFAGQPPPHRGFAPLLQSFASRHEWKGLHRAGATGGRRAGNVAGTNEVHNGRAVGLVHAACSR
jgi:hypothetical protein